MTLLLAADRPNDSVRWSYKFASWAFVFLQKNRNDSHPMQFDKRHERQIVGDVGCYITVNLHDISNYPQLDGFFNSSSCYQQRNHFRSAPLAFCEGNQPVTGWFPSQRASNTEIVSIPWRLLVHRYLIRFWLHSVITGKERWSSILTSIFTVRGHFRKYRTWVVTM